MSYSTGSGPVYRAADTERLSSLFDDNVTTQWELMKVNSIKYKNNPMCGTRDVSKGIDSPGDFVWQTYGEVFDMMKETAAGLKSLDLVQPDTTGNLKLLGLCGTNSVDWMLAEFGCFALGGTTGKELLAYSSNNIPLFY